MKKLIIGLLIFVSSACLAQSTDKITQHQLLVNQMSVSPFTIIDVRSAAEFSDGHIKGAINIPFDEIDQHQEALSKLRGDTLVVYCRSGRRAGIFIKELLPKGYKLKHLEGDMQKWQASSMPIVN
ncbi:rhodanese-like domain-containing protein [Pseudoalteromonas peptidolytica]|nr:rhodanese-like domain-containing protein [Pseudoalteromonas peptidolytica]NLR14273.1 rhodanese-like domain-containing protein [Pseudoalteromonas peptidolytica]GEK09545.1 phage shock protein E [Pseudoalteromonas peptidolytica]